MKLIKWFSIIHSQVLLVYRMDIPRKLITRIKII